VLWAVAGKDATEEFYSLHRQEVLQKYKKLAIGVVANEKPQIILQKEGEFSTVPYAEASFVQGKPSPYFNESHVAFRKACREFYDKEIVPESVSMETLGE
jgi:hypothetical protein